MSRILIIDDELVIRQVLRKILQDAGHEIIEALDGAEGLQIFRETPVDLVITDIMLPEEGGLKIISEIHATNPAVKIIAISALAYDAFAIAQKLGANAAFEKPLDMQELLATVNRLLTENS